MVPIEQENDIEVVRTCAILYRDELKRMAAENAALKIKTIPDTQENWLESLKDRLSRLETKFFGFGREEITPKSPRPVGHRQQKLKLHGKRPHTSAEASQPSSGNTKLEKSKDVRRSAVVSRIEHDLSLKAFQQENTSREIAVPVGEEAKTAWQKIEDLNQESYEITIVERTYQKTVHSQAKYRLKAEYNKTGKQVIITAPGPVKLKPGCQYSVDFALAVVADKYESHLPLERQRRRMAASGLEMSVKTLYGLVRQVAEHCDAAVIPKIRRDILSDFCAAHLDESTWPILGNKTRGQMWVLTNRIGSYYRFEPTRSGLIAEEMLEGYSGSAVTDGFSGYNRIKRLPQIRVGQCWAHARREFYERIGDYPKEATEFVDLIAELYSIEDRAESFEQLRQLRSTESKSLIEKMRVWLWETKSRFLGQEGLNSAIDYCLKFWPELTLFLRDLSVPLDNNSAERAERHAVMGRKNFGGSKTIDGADVAATLYTVIESSKKVGLEPREYLKYVITERWHGRDPKSPLELSLERFGKNHEVVFPAKDQWRV